MGFSIKKEPEGPQIAFAGNTEQALNLSVAMIRLLGDSRVWFDFDDRGGFTAGSKGKKPLLWAEVVGKGVRVEAEPPKEKRPVGRPPHNPHDFSLAKLPTHQAATWFKVRLECESPYETARPSDAFLFFDESGARVGCVGEVTMRQVVREARKRVERNPDGCDILLEYCRELERRGVKWPDSATHVVAGVVMPPRVFKGQRALVRSEASDRSAQS